MARGRNVINQAIALEGGDEIVAQLRKMGAEGEAAAKKLEAAFRGATLAKSFGAALNNLKTSFAGLQVAGARVAESFGRVRNSVANVGGAFAGTTARIGLFTTALTAAFAASAVSIRRSLDQVGDLTDLAASIGASVEDLQALQLAGAQAGAGEGEFVKAIATLSESLQELNAASGEASSGFTRLNGSFEQATINGVKVIRAVKETGGAAGEAGKETDKLSDKARALQAVLARVGIPPGRKLVPLEVLKAVADAFSRMENGAEKTQLAIDLFGPKLGPKLIPFLNMGGKAIDGYKDKLGDLGALISGEQAQVADAASDALVEIGKVFEQYRDKFASLLAPGVLAATGAIMKTLDENSAAIERFMSVAGENFVTVVQDVINLLSGGPDGRLRNQWILDLRNGFLAVKTAATDLFANVLIPAFQSIRQYAQPVAEAINAIFGSSLTGDQLLIGAAVLQLAGGFRLLFSVLGLGVNSLLLFVNVLRLIAPLGKVLTGIWPLVTSGVKALLATLPRLAVFFSPAGLIAAGVIGLGALLYAFWDEMVAGAKSAFAFLQEAFSAGWEGIKSVTASAFEGVKTIFADSWTGLTAVASSAFEGLKTLYAGLWAGLTTLATEARLGLITAASDVWAGITSTVTLAREGLFLAASQTWSAISEAASGVAAALAPVWQGIIDGAAAAFAGVANLVVQAWSGASQSVVDSAAAIRDAIATATRVAGDIAGAAEIAAALVRPFLDAQNRIREITASFGSLAQSGFASVSAAISSAAASIQRQIDAIIGSLRRAVAEAQRLRAQAASSGGSGFASGGYVRGQGGPTSDSIPAWLSNGEFVIRAAAVRKYGVDFLRAINGLNAGPMFRDGFPGFALGGPVSVAPPSLVAAGTASGRPVVLTLGAETFRMVADNDVAEKLIRYSARRRVNSAGRKPSWYGA